MDFVKMIWKMDGHQLAQLEILNGAPPILIKLILGGAAVMPFIQAGFQLILWLVRIASESDLKTFSDMNQNL